MDRTIVQADALAWLTENPAPARASVVTSLPDVSELPLPFEDWRGWFVDAARRVLRWVPDAGVAIFYQSDIRHRGAWIDKGHLVQRAAEEEGADLLWHKIVCRHRAGTVSLGRPSYSHMLCFARGPRPMRRPGPDVLADAGFASWSRAMGVQACRVACEFLRDEVAVDTLVVDPFCGRGTVLAVANALGLDALGVDVSAKRCRAARSLELEDGVIHARSG